jgi:hypothetical protein
MDMDLLLRVMANTDWLYLPNALASFRIQSGTKTSTAEAYFAREMFVLLERVLSQRVAYPKLQHLNAPTLRCIFYRRASKHYYMAGHFRESAALIAQAVRLNPRMFFSIAQDEGVGWLVRRLTPPWVYRRLGAFYRTKKNA